MQKKHSYAISDRHLIDYQLYNFHNFELRGPKSEKNKYISYIGGGQTFGRYCQKPFSNILGNKLNIGTLNFGRGGVGPNYFLKNETIINAINQTELVVVQVLSGRSVNNSVFFSPNDNGYGIRLIDNQEMKAIQIFKDLIIGKDIRGRDINFIKNLVEETRQNYLDGMISLLKKIKVPKILFWFSVRHPRYQESYDDNARYKEFIRSKINNILETVSKNRIGFFRGYAPEKYIYGDFPHLVNEQIVEMLKPHSDTYVECITKVGLPQTLINFRGEKVRTDNYYPSPQMHQ